MRFLFDLILPGLKSVYSKFKERNKTNDLNRICNSDSVSDIIYNLLMSDKPCMVARYGSTEMSCMINYLGVTSKHHSLIKYIMGEQLEWWWNKKILNQMQQWSGFFPATEKNAKRFSEMMLEDSSQLDVLAIWSSRSLILSDYYKKAIKTSLISLEPYFSTRPWTRALGGKKVLVIHPFANQIRTQYQNHRCELFTDKNVLPEFELYTITAVQSLGGINDEFEDWFHALDWMKSEMDKIDYDVALIGCGAYGFPLAAYAKKTGHKAIHLAGALQLLFGIRGKRWDDPNYGNGKYQKLFNENWVYPDAKFKPANASSVENGCYWK